MSGLETEKKVESPKKEIPIQIRQAFPSEMAENSATSHLTSMYSGPIPPPEYLTLYEKMVPGIAKRFLEEPHFEAEHRRNLERKMIEAQIELAKKGQLIASMLAGACVVGSFAAIFFGHNLWGLGALLLSIGGFVGVFIYGKNHKSGRS
jgi:uncharacterized membrane protein